MNLVKLSDAKIEDSMPIGKGKKFLTPTARNARQEAIDREEQFSLIYGNMLDDKHISITREAEAIGKSPATVHLYSKVEEQRNLPAALIPMSIIGRDIMECLAAELGGTFLIHEGHPEGSKRNRVSQALRVLSIINDDECGTDCEIKQWKELLRIGEEALETLAKK